LKVWRSQGGDAKRWNEFDEAATVQAVGFWLN
jgi:hypothetical protein